MFWVLFLMVTFDTETRKREFDVFLTVHHSIDLFQITTVMHTSFIL